MDAATACPRCGTRTGGEVALDSGERVCIRCLFSVTRQTPAELESARVSEMETVAQAAAPPLEAPPSLPNYEIEGVLGRGGMGVVYKARQKGLDRAVAIKVLRPGSDDDAEGLQRFMNEARSAARLQHAHIVSVFEVSSVDGKPFFSMEYVDGRPLGDWMREPGRTPSELAATLRKVALAVQHAHEAGVVHRDLKPANILVDRRGEPKVTDFGIAKDITADARITRYGLAIGTPAYMAPEQAAGENERVGPRSDVYALGAVLYEGLVKRAPFKAESLSETLRKVVAGELVPPRKIDPSVPRDLEAVCLRAMARAPEDRYPSALAFAEALALRAAPRRPLWPLAALVAAAAIAIVAWPRPGTPPADSSVAEALGKRLRETRGEERKRAAASLLELGRDGLPVWRTLLTDADAELRWRAAEALGDLKDRESIPALVLALRDPDRDVGRRAAEALEAREAAPAIVALLKDPDAKLRRRARELLVRLEVREAVPTLRALLKHETARAREDAADTLGSMGAREAIPDLVALLADEHTGVRETAVLALGRLAAKEAAADLERLAKDDPSSAVREAAAQVLATLLK